MNDKIIEKSYSVKIAPKLYDTIFSQILKKVEKANNLDTILFDKIPLNKYFDLYISVIPLDDGILISLVIPAVAEEFISFFYDSKISIEKKIKVGLTTLLQSFDGTVFNHYIDLFNKLNSEKRRNKQKNLSNKKIVTLNSFKSDYNYYLKYYNNQVKKYAFPETFNCLLPIDEVGLYTNIQTLENSQTGDGKNLIQVDIGALTNTREMSIVREQNKYRKLVRQGNDFVDKGINEIHEKYYQIGYRAVLQGMTKPLGGSIIFFNDENLVKNIYKFCTNFKTNFYAVERLRFKKDLFTL